MTIETIALPIAEIGELPPQDYVGLIDDDAVACLTPRLAAEGLLTPIWVRRNGNAAKFPWSVIAGRHRLRAALQLGWAEIAAQERAGPTSGPEELRRLQVVENLDRRELRPIERARFVMERWREAAARIMPGASGSQQMEAARERWTVWEAISHTKECNRREVDQATGLDCGRTDRWVRIYRRLFETVVVPFPDLVAQLNAHPLGESLAAMNRLATVGVEESRRRAIEMVLSKPDWKSIDEALLAANIGDDRGARSTPGQLMLATWEKLPPIEQKSHVEWLAMNAPKPLARAMAAKLKARGILD